MHPYNLAFHPYDKISAVAYSHRWALSRNPDYFDYSSLGGDCTNYISQCLYAGSKIMNYTKNFGWYYINANEKAPAWTGVPYLYNFLTRKEQSPGPFGEEVSLQNIGIGDIIQLSFRKNSNFAHSLFVVHIGMPADYNNILINTHTYDRQNYPLSKYNWERIRFIKILGVRK
jgi:hypothetical protein